MNSKKTIFYFIRHGESEGNISDIYGDSDTQLTPLGITQAKKRGEMFQKINFHRIYSSPLIRARQTAEYINLYINVPHHIDGQIIERRFGSLSGKSHHDVKKQFGDKLNQQYMMTNEELFDFRLTPDQESNREALLRSLNFINKKTLEHTGETIGVVSHGNIIRTLLVYLGYAVFHELPAGSVRNTGYIVVASYNGKHYIEQAVDINKEPLINSGRFA